MVTRSTSDPKSSDRSPGSPYCSNCGYDLAASTESSKCPECGRPIVEVLVRGPAYLQAGKRYRSKTTLFGLPVIDIALGPKGTELRGKARGIIAIGDVATGLLAIGGVARGLVAFGGMAIGGFSIGGMSIGLFTALGGGAIGSIAMGGGAGGIIAQGGGAAGVVAQGGGALGVYARGGGAWGVHTISMRPTPPSPEALEMFDRLSWLLGAWPPTSWSMLTNAAVPLVCTIAVAAIIALVAMFAMRREPES